MLALTESIDAIEADPTRIAMTTGVATTANTTGAAIIVIVTTAGVATVIVTTAGNAMATGTIAARLNFAMVG
jgi:hypothetical protein